jgi:flagellin
MSLNISTNTAAARAGINLSKNSRLLQKSFDRLASGRRLSSPMDDPGGLAVSMKLQASINRLSGAQSNVQNAISFLEVQDGMLDTVGKILDRMSELKGLASADPMKSTQDRASYNNEFKDLQSQLYDISQMKFNGVSLFARHHSADDGTSRTNGEALFQAQDQMSARDNTLTIYTSAEGAAGSKVSMHKSLLLSALTLETYGDLRSSIYKAGSGTTAAAVAFEGNVLHDTAGTTFVAGADRGNSYNNTADLGGTTGKINGKETSRFIATFAVEGGSASTEFLDLDDISVGVFTKALENISFLRSQNGGVQSRMSFNLESLGQQKTNMMAALGRIVDVDIAEETTNLSKYSILQQAAASMLAQANQSSDVALMLLR